jgi:hypothetical protein
MHRTVFIACVLGLSLTLTGCGPAQPASDEVAEAIKRVSVGVEGQKMEFWAPTDLAVSLDDPTPTGDALQLRLIGLEVQTQQPPAMPALRLSGQMQLVNQVAEGEADMTLINYVPRFLDSAGEVLSVESDEAYPIIEAVEAGGEVTVEFKALIPATGDDWERMDPEPSIAELSIQVNYALGEAGHQETLTFPLTFGPE